MPVGTRFISAVAFYGPKTGRLRGLLAGVQALIAEHLGDDFRPYSLEQVHATLIALNGVRAGGTIVNEYYLTNRGMSREMDLVQAMSIVTESFASPLEVRIGGSWPHRETPFTSRGRHPLERCFSVQGNAFVLVGWPTASLAGARRPLDELRRKMNAANVLHRYHAHAADIDNDLYLVVGHHADAAAGSLKQTEAAVRDNLADDPADLAITMEDIKIVASDSHTLEPPLYVSDIPADESVLLALMSSADDCACLPGHLGRTIDRRELGAARPAVTYLAPGPSRTIGRTARLQQDPQPLPEKRDALTMSTEEYDVCLSFAAEQRPYVNSVARILSGYQIRVFYDSDFESDLWGKNLYEELTRIYRDKARYCVLFISEDYIQKRWTTLEWRAAQDRALSESHEYVLPVRFDDSPLPGLAHTIGYIDARLHEPEKVATLIREKLIRDKEATAGLMPSELLARAASMGLVGIENRGNPAHASPPANYLRLASREIMVTGLTAKYTFTRLAGNLFDALSRGIKVRAMLLDPSSADLAWLQNQESVDIEREIEFVRSIIVEQFANHPNFEARCFPYAPPFTGILLDGSFARQENTETDIISRLRVQPAVRHATQHSGLVLEFQAVPRSSNVDNVSTPLEFFSHDLEKQWESASRRI